MEPDSVDVCVFSDAPVCNVPKVRYTDYNTYNNNVFLTGIVIGLLLLLLLVAVVMATSDFFDHTPDVQQINAIVEESEQANQNDDVPNVGEGIETAKNIPVSKIEHETPEVRTDMEAELETDEENHSVSEPISNQPTDYFRDFTLQQLNDFNGSCDDRPILLGVNKKVYDVTKNKRCYGPGHPCAVFAGINVESKSLEKIVKDKYTCVGKLVLTLKEEAETPTSDDINFTCRLRKLKEQLDRKVSEDIEEFDQLVENNDEILLPASDVTSDKVEESEETDA